LVLSCPVKRMWVLPPFGPGGAFGFCGLRPGFGTFQEHWPAGLEGIGAGVVAQGKKKPNGGDPPAKPYYTTRPALF